MWWKLNPSDRTYVPTDTKKVSCEKSKVEVAVVVWDCTELPRTLPLTSAPEEFASFHNAIRATPFQPSCKWVLDLFCCCCCCCCKDCHTVTHHSGSELKPGGNRARELEQRMWPHSGECGMIILQNERSCWSAFYFWSC